METTTGDTFRPQAGPLQGIRIIDLSTVVMGPYASQTLAEYGAEVIKIEAPGGDSTRHIGPGLEEGMASLFLAVNRNKRSVVLDLKTSADRDILLAMLPAADVFMHNMRPDKLDTLGLGPSVLRSHNPCLVFASLTGFSSEGPYSGQPAYDDVIQGLSGLAAMMEVQSGTPRYMPTTVADKVGSLAAVSAIMAGLLQRGRTGKGVNIEVPMFESVVSFGLVEHLQGSLFDPPLSPIGYRRAFMPARRPYPTSDGYLCIMPYSDGHWNAFLEEVGDEEARHDTRFASLSERTRNIEALYERLGDHLQHKTTDEWLDICRRLDIPATRLNRLEELKDDPHLKAVGHFVRMEDAAMGTLVFPANPVSFDGWKPVTGMPPRLGQDTQAVLREMAGVSPVEQAA